MLKNAMAVAAVLCVTHSFAIAGDIRDLFDLAADRGSASGVVTGRFAESIRDYTQAEGDIHVALQSAGTYAGCRMFSMTLRMNVRTVEGPTVPFEQPLMVPVCANGLPPVGFLPPDMHERLVENLSEILED